MKKQFGMMVVFPAIIYAVAILGARVEGREFVSAEKRAMAAGYPAPDAMIAQIYDLAKKFPKNAEIIEYGKSVEGRPLLAVRIAGDLKTFRPGAAITANVHGNEWIGNRVAMAAALRLLADAGSDPWIASLLSRMDFYVLPSLNPDGYYLTYAGLTDPKILLRNTRKNAHRVDLNRNFEPPASRSPHAVFAGGKNPGDEDYAGTSAYSEPETAGVRDFFTAHPVFSVVHLHSSWGYIFPAKCNGAKCVQMFKTMCAAANARQPHVKYPCVGTRRYIDSFGGELEDTLYYHFGALAVCWEVMPTGKGTEQAERLKHVFWQYNPEDIGYWVENDRDGVLAALEGAFEATGGKPVPEEQRRVK